MDNLTLLDKLFDLWLKDYPTEIPKKVYDKPIKLNIGKSSNHKKRPETKVQKRKSEDTENNLLRDHILRNDFDKNFTEVISSEKNVISNQAVKHKNISAQDLSKLEKADNSRRKNV